MLVFDMSIGVTQSTITRLLGRRSNLIYLNLYDIIHMSNVVTKQIKIKDETYDELKRLGKMQETFDSVITRILDHYKKTAKK